MKAAELSSRGLVRLLRVDNRMLQRWRKGTQPDLGHLVTLFNLATEMACFTSRCRRSGSPRPSSDATNLTDGGRGRRSGNLLARRLRLPYGRQPALFYSKAASPWILLQ